MVNTITARVTAERREETRVLAAMSLLSYLIRGPPWGRQYRFFAHAHAQREAHHHEMSRGSWKAPGRKSGGFPLAGSLAPGSGTTSFCRKIV